MTVSREEFDALVRRVSDLEQFATSAVGVAAMPQPSERILEGIFEGFVARVRARDAAKEPRP